MLVRITQTALIVLALSVVAGPMGAQTMTPAPNPNHAPHAPAAQSAAGSAMQTTLALIGPTSQSVIDQAMLAALPHQSVTIENMHTHASETYSGVRLIDLLIKVGAPAEKDVHGKALSEYIVATGADGYKAVLSLVEVEPELHPGEVIVADQMAGKPLDAKEGPFRLVVSQDRRPARSVHNLVKLELKSE